MTTKRKATGVPKNTFRSAYNLGNEDDSETFNDGLTAQHHTDQCDINKILAQFMETGIMPQTKANPQYGDVSNVDFTEMQNTLATRTRQNSCLLDTTVTTDTFWWKE